MKHDRLSFVSYISRLFLLNLMLNLLVFDDLFYLSKSYFLMNLRTLQGWLYKAIAFSLLPTKETFMINQERELDHSLQLEALVSVMVSLHVWSVSTNLLELQYKNSLSMALAT